MQKVVGFLFIFFGVLVLAENKEPIKVDINAIVDEYKKNPELNVSSREWHELASQLNTLNKPIRPLIKFLTPTKEEEASKRDVNSLANRILRESNSGDTKTLIQLETELSDRMSSSHKRNKLKNKLLEELSASPHILTHPRGAEDIISLFHRHSGPQAGSYELEQILSRLIQRIVANTQESELSTLPDKLEYFHNQLEELQKSRESVSYSADCIVLVSLLSKVKKTENPISSTEISIYKKVIKRTFYAGKQLDKTCILNEKLKPKNAAVFMNKLTAQQIIEEINNTVSPEGKINFDPFIIEKTNKVIETTVQSIDGLEGLFTVSVERDINCKNTDFTKALNDNIEKLKLTKQIHSQCSTDTTAASSTGDDCKTIIKITRLSNDEFNNHRQYQNNLQSLAAIYDRLLTDELARKAKLTPASQ